MEKIARTADLANLEELLEFIRSYCDKHNLPLDKQQHLELAAEEALVNVISYGYPEVKGSVEVVCEYFQQAVSVTITDKGVPFDMLAHPEPDTLAPLEARREGGLGVHFIRKIMDQIHYHRDQDENQLTLIKAGHRGDSAPQLISQSEAEEMRRAFDGQMAEMDRMNSLSRLIIEQMDLNTLLGKVIEASKEMCQAEVGSLFLLSDDKQHLIFDISVGSNSGLTGRKLPMGQGIVGFVAENQKSLLIADAYDDPRFNPAYDKETGFRTKSILSAPLILRGQLIGVLQLLNRADGGAFEERQLSLLEQFCNYISIAIHNARMYENLLQEKHRLKDALVQLTETLERERTLKSEKARIEAEKMRMEQELNIAREIQANMLPQVFPLKKEFEMFAVMDPAREVGGDFYDFFYLDENRFCIVIGDVSEKGVPAALYMVITKTLIKTIALQGAPLHDVLFKVNNMLSEDNTSCMFVTLFCAVVDISTGEMVYTNAGHNPPFIAAPNNDFTLLDLPEGAILGPIPGLMYQSKSVLLSPGHTVFIYTDGVSEAMNAKGELFGMDRLEQVLNQTRKANAKDFCKALSTSLEVYADKTEQSDDITLIVFHYKGPEPK